MSMNTTIDLSEMRAFVAVVTHKSFTTAAVRLGTDKARLSRIVQRMEEKLGAQLLTRSTRRLNVTEVGRNYFERAVCILNAADAAEAAVAQQSGEPKGLLKITAGSEYGPLIVDSWIVEFLRIAPGVTVETEYTDRIVDIIHEGINVAIRIGALQDSELSARKLGEMSYGLYASPDYLRDIPAIKKTDDLKKHALIMKTTNGRANWTLNNKDKTVTITDTPRAALSSTIGVKNLVLAGLGIAQLPRFMGDPLVTEGKLSVVLPGWARQSVPVHAIFASSRYMDPKVRGFVDLAVKRFQS